MSFTIVAILTLIVLAAGSELLLRVDIDFPQEVGRKESEDIQFIEQTVSDLKHVKVFFARKNFDSGRIFLVLEVDRMCEWSTLTSAMSERGYKLTVTQLQYCSEYAAELGVNFKYAAIEDANAADIIEEYHTQFYDVDKTTDEYDAMMKKHFERDRIVIEEGNKYTCFRKIGSLPVHLMYFGILNSSDHRHLFQELRNDGKCSMTLDFVQSFGFYSQTC